MAERSLLLAITLIRVKERKELAVAWHSSKPCNGDALFTTVYKEDGQVISLWIYSHSKTELSTERGVFDMVSYSYKLEL